MYQSGALFGSMTVLENVRLPLDEFTDLPDAAKELVALAKLKLVSMEAAAGKMPAELSGGMQKRAAIARAMALDPGILFLDEPSAGLDPITSAGLDALIKDLSRNLGITFVIVTHELQSIFAIADRVIMLDGKTKGIIGDRQAAGVAGSFAQSLGAPVLQPAGRAAPNLNQLIESYERKDQQLQNRDLRPGGHRPVGGRPAGLWRAQLFPEENPV